MLWNFLVDNFLIWNHLVMQNYNFIWKLLNSIFWIDLGWKDSLIIFLGLEKLWNLVFDNLFILNHLVMQKERLNFLNLKFKFFKRPQIVKLHKWKL